MTHTSTEQERAEFEAYIKSTPEWLRGAPWLDRTDDGSYKNTNTVFLFGIWQASASRRAQVVPQGWRLIPEDATEEWLTALREKGVRIGSFESLLTDVLAAAPQPPEAAKAECWCLTCRPLTLQDMRFVICPDCGNKRCPKANNHANACTNSNAPGQKGSSWEHVKPIAEAAPVQLQESISTVLEDCRSRAIDYATCPSPYNRTRMDTAFQLLDHQVRQLLAAHGIGKDKA